MADVNIRVATDVGGTFTDLAYFESDPDTGEQRVRTAKVDTTPPDFERGVLELLHKADVPFSEIGFLPFVASFLGSSCIIKRHKWDYTNPKMIIHIFI